MRRSRQLREYRERVLKNQPTVIKNNKSSTLRDLNKKKKNKSVVITTPINNVNKTDAVVDVVQKPNQVKQNIVSSPFASYENYQCKLAKPINICHVIESLGLGGAQTMMIELNNALQKYYGEQTKNYFVCVNSKPIFYDKNLYTSYNVHTISLSQSSLHQFLIDKQIDVVIHHRIAISKCIRKYLPTNCKYILVNHTWHNMMRMIDFQSSDIYVSVCDFLHEKTQYYKKIHDSRKFVILNGIEDEYIDNLVPISQEGTLRTGRCHRLVWAKFRPDSLQWMKTTVMKAVPGFTHSIIGSSPDAKAISKRHSFIKYYGTILNRDKKMSIIKGLDLYFYETFSDEGASIAILESLACGVPVLTKSLGGCGELVKNGINGFIMRDRDEYLIRIQQLNFNTKMLSELKQSTLNDFKSRLHVRQTAAKYMQLFEKIL